jgi:NAD(P)-dependent dehydrogenase (short-subunit alcohol dehydrogenase family)
MRLKDKTALITGGTSGIGLATARRFVEEGARVAVTGTDPRRLEDARQALGATALALRADAASVSDQHSVAQAIAKEFGKLDALFINAGIADLRAFDQWDEAGFDRSIAINVKGPYFLIQALLPYFADPAAIVLNGSVNAHIGMATTTVYAASKAALVSLARTLSGELIGRGIRVNVVSPGPIETPLHSRGMTPAEIEARHTGLIGQIPAGRFGDPVEIANTVVFLASGEARFIVGSELIIDGGMITL